MSGFFDFLWDNPGWGVAFCVALFVGCLWVLCLASEQQRKDCLARGMDYGVTGHGFSSNGDFTTMYGCLPRKEKQ